jgi:hypothetical protein
MDENLEILKQVLKTKIDLAASTEVSQVTTNLTELSK